MNKVTNTRELCSEFIRESLAEIQKVVSDIPTIPSFFVRTDERRTGRYQFVETEQTNWWLLPKTLKQLLNFTTRGQKLATLFEETAPFSEVIGKCITISDFMIGSSYKSGKSIVETFLTSYLFAAGCHKWSASKFDRIWNDCLDYFDPSVATLEYFLFAPVDKIFGIKSHITLDDGLVIRRLPLERVAELASLDDNLAGRHVVHRLTLWTTCFFVKRLHSKKIVEPDGSRMASNTGDALRWESVLNEEVALLRSLLSVEISVPTFSFIRDGYPRYDGTGILNSLPWRTRSPFSDTRVTDKDVRRYVKRRAKFLALHGEPGWENAAISMRRFAIAWENPFRADILADIVTALEQLVVDSNTEVSYKLRTRVAHFLGRSHTERQAIAKNINDAYVLRSKVVHGGYVFDNPRELEGARRMKGAKGKGGNPFHDINEIQRLIYSVSQYYRTILNYMIDRSTSKIYWDERAL